MENNFLINITDLVDSSGTLDKDKLYESFNFLQTSDWAKEFHSLTMDLDEKGEKIIAEFSNKEKAVKIIKKGSMVFALTSLAVLNSGCNNTKPSTLSTKIKFIASSISTNNDGDHKLNLTYNPIMSVDKDGSINFTFINKDKSKNVQLENSKYFRFQSIIQKNLVNKKNSVKESLQNKELDPTNPNFLAKKSPKLFIKNILSKAFDSVELEQNEKFGLTKVEHKLKFGLLFYKPMPINDKNLELDLIHNLDKQLKEMVADLKTYDIGVDILVKIAELQDAELQDKGKIDGNHQNKDISNNFRNLIKKSDDNIDIIKKRLNDNSTNECDKPTRRVFCEID